MKRIFSLDGDLKNLESTFNSVEKMFKRDINLPDFRDIQYCVQSHSECITVSHIKGDSTLSYDGRFTSLFRIEDYEIKEQSEFFKNYEQYREILETTQKWCDKSKLKEEEK